MQQRRASVYMRKRKAGYTAIFYDPDRTPQQKYVTLRTKDKVVARRKLTDLEDQYSRGYFDPWNDNAPESGVFASQAVERFLKTKAGECRPKTIQAYRGALNAFLGSLRTGMQIEHIEGRHVRAFYERTGLSETSRNTYFRQLRTFFKWCVDAGLLRVSPIKDLKAPSAPRKVVSFLTQDDYEKLCTAIEAHLVLEAKHIQEGEVVWLLDLIKIAVGSGMRRGELCAMRWSWVNLDEGTITVQNGKSFKTKNGNERVVYISPEARATLRRRYEERTEEGDTYVFLGVYGDMLNGHYVSKRFRFFRDLAKLSKHIHFHSLRHTYGSWLAQRGVDLYRIKELMGHTSMETTMRYAHLQPEHLRDAVQRAFGTM